MTTIPNLNLVIQQGNAVIEAKSALHPSLDKNHLSSAYQVEKEEAQRTSIQEAEEKEKIRFDLEDLNKEKKLERKFKKKEDKKENKEEPKQDIEKNGVGKNLNTIAMVCLIDN